MNNVLALTLDHDTLMAVAGYAGAVLLVLHAILFVAALVSILRASAYAAGGKALWILAVFAFPVVGPISWFLAGRKAGLLRA
jgi:hypothetical protein